MLDFILDGWLVWLQLAASAAIAIALAWIAYAVSTSTIRLGRIGRELLRQPRGRRRAWLDEQLMLRENRRRMEDN